MSTSMDDDRLFLDERHAEESEIVTEAWWKWLMWPLFGFAAILILELTASISLSSFVFCMKFGMSDFLYARWLGRHDPDPARRRACVALQYAMGAFKVVLTGTVLSVIFMLVAAGQQQIQNGFSAAAVTVGLTALFGFFISSGFALFGARAASRSGVLVWVDRSMCHKPLTVFPPDRISELNELPSLIGAVKVMSTMVCLFLMTITLIFVPMIPDSAVLCVTFAVWVYSLCKLGRLKACVNAITPEDCWPELKEDLEPTLGASLLEQELSEPQMDESSLT